MLLSWERKNIVRAHTFLLLCFPREILRGLDKQGGFQMSRISLGSRMRVIFAISRWCQYKMRKKPNQAIEWRKQQSGFCSAPGADRHGKCSASGWHYWCISPPRAVSNVRFLGLCGSNRIGGDGHLAGWSLPLSACAPVSLPPRFPGVIGRVM